MAEQLNQNATEVAAIDLPNLKNATYVEFMTTFQTIINSKAVVLEKVVLLPAELDALMVKLNASLVAERGNSHTMTLAESDKKRDNLHRALCYVVEAHCLTGDESNVEAAMKLKRVIKRYGTSALRNSAYSDETALIRSLLSDLNEAENVTYSTQIGLTSWITGLTNANSAFEQLMEGRRTEASEALGYTTRDVRKELSPLYRTIVKVVESFALLGVDPQFAEVIIELNPEIAYLK